MCPEAHFSKPVNLLDSSLTKLKTLLESFAEKPFRAEQILRWVYRSGVRDWNRMTDISLASRAQLQRHAGLEWPHVAETWPSQDGTLKWKVQLKDGAQVETVYIPEKGRGTLCLSSQVGCPLACAFCATGQQGFQRNLTLSEVMGQVGLAFEALQAWPTSKSLAHPVTNIVFMGMGEPLLNFEVVKGACELLLHPKLFGFSKRRVTISTSGIVPALHAMYGTLDVALAVSLHAPTDVVRSQIMPVNLTYPLTQLIQALKRYQPWSQANRSGITIEYTLLEGVNDSLEDAQNLIRLLAHCPSKINLIPWNSVPGAPFKRSSEVAMSRFAQFLSQKGWVVTVRRSRGDATHSACGQLVGKVQSRLQKKLKKACQEVSR